MIKKLRIKFVVINMTIVTLLLGIILSLTYCLTSARMEIQSVQMMQKIAAAPFRESARLQTGEEMRLPYFAICLGPYGERLAVGGGYYALNGEELDSLIETVLASGKRTGVIPKYSLRYCRIDGAHNQFLVFADISSEIQALQSLLHTCLLIGLLGFLGFLGASILLSAWAIRPVDRAFRAQQQFIADASHELKTPLTVIKTNAQLMEAYPDSPELQGKSLSSILLMSEQMRSLIEQMLTLARGDYGKEHRIRTAVDLSTLVQQTLLPFEPVFFEQGKTLETDLLPETTVNGDPNELRQALEILLDNAGKYAQEHSTVWVRLTALSRHRCRLTVANQGPHMEKEELEACFDRFTCGDPSRNQRGSFGLGLAIARGIAEHHRGHLWAESKDGINSFHLDLPAGKSGG